MKWNYLRIFVQFIFKRKLSLRSHFFQFERYQKSVSLNVRIEKYFLDLIESTRNQIVFTIFRLILIQMDVRLNPNQSENCKYNLISGGFYKIYPCIRVAVTRIYFLVYFRGTKLIIWELCIHSEKHISVILKAIWS